MVEDGIGQCVGLIDTVDGIVGGGGDIDIYWGDSIEIEADEAAAIPGTTEFWGSDDSIGEMIDWDHFHPGSTKSRRI